MSEASARISFVTPAEKRQRLDEIADAFGKNLSAIINDALDQYLDLHEWQILHIQKGIDAARKGDFATDEEVERFFEEYGGHS